MTVRSALVLGILLIAAALVHGGLYSAGHDFVMNRFTGRYEFVPADEGDDDVRTPTRATVRSCLKRARLAATNVALQSRR
jgi:hypothetical protein